MASRMNKRTICTLSGMPLLMAMAGCGEREYSTGYVEPRFGHTVPESATHVEFSFRRPRTDGPASGVDPAPRVLKIPKEYVYLPHVRWIGDDLERIELRVQFPGAIPWRDWNEQERSLRSQISDPLVRRFILELGAGGALNAWNVLFKHDILPNQVDRTTTYWMRSGEEFGLKRYVQVYCLTEEDILRPESARALNDRASGDDAPSNCKTLSEQKLFVSHAQGHDMVNIHCGDGSKTCRLRFHDRQGLGLEVAIRRGDLKHWREVVDRVRILIASFV